VDSFGSQSPQPLSRCVAASLTTGLLLLVVAGCEGTIPEPDAEWKAMTLAMQARSVDYPGQFLWILARQGNLPQDSLLADSVANQLESREYYRLFSRRARHRPPPDGMDLIHLAKASSGRVTFTYHRNGDRIGLQTGLVTREGGQIIFSGRWYQQSKMDGAGSWGHPRRYEAFTTADDSASAWKRLGWLDQGVFVYWGSFVDGKLDLSHGRDLNLLDEIRAHDSWLLPGTAIETRPARLSNGAGNEVE